MDFLFHLLILTTKILVDILPISYKIKTARVAPERQDTAPCLPFFISADNLC